MAAIAALKGKGRKDSNSALGLVFLMIIGVMLIPMPSMVLDMLLCINITAAFLIMMAVLNSNRPADFNTFPTVLLFTALFRLALNVASTRLILLEADAGAVIRTFGEFVVGGQPVVGVIIFLILVVIQFVVITRGQNRISEVTARFTLDAMPGKQMSIDADLSAGIITNEEAKARRKDLSEEAEFYGSMDGAGKFVRGDAVAGIIITGINIVAGLVIGIIYRDLEPLNAMGIYTLLTVGDGLVAQIPGLVISTAAGILVTKTGSERGLSAELGHQMLRKPKALQVVAGVISALGLLPGMPTVFFFGIAGLLFFGANRINADIDREDTAAEQETKEDDEETVRENRQNEVEQLLQVDRLGVEIGYRLISLVEEGKNGGLLEHIRSVRRQFAGSLGIVVPPIRVKDNVQIDPNCYRILLGGQEVGRGELRAGQYLAMDPTGTAGPIPGVDTVEPAFGLPARWITEADRDRAELEGYTVIDAPSVMITHLTEVVKRIAGELLTRDDVKQLMDNIKRETPAVVEELVPAVLNVGQVQSVLSNLLKEGVPIRNLQTILEALADHGATEKDPRMLTERVRSRICRSILEPHLDLDGTLHAAVIDPDLERNLAEAVAGQAGLSQLPAGFLARFVDSTAEALGAMVQEGRDPVLITRASLRPFLAEAVAGAIPGAAVLSYQETAPASKVETRSRIAVPA